MIAKTASLVELVARTAFELRENRPRFGALQPLSLSPPVIPKVLDIDPFHGRELALWAGAARSAMPHGFPGTSVERRTDPRGPIRPTVGRPQRPSRRPLRIHGAARLWCTTPRRETAPSETAFEGGEMSQYQGPLVLVGSPAALCQAIEAPGPAEPAWVRISSWCSWFGRSSI